MYEFGDELIIESFKVPWLIWIQLLVMVLILFLLFFGFTVFTLDPSDNSAAASGRARSSSAAVLGGGVYRANCSLPITGSSRPTDQGQDEIHCTEGGTETSTSRGIRRGEERDDTSVKDATHFRLSERSHHPCHYFGLAKQAFLKCLGLDSNSDSSNNRKCEKED